MQAALVTSKIETPGAATRKTWLAPRLRVESIAEITRGGDATLSDNCGTVGGRCVVDP
jgi:hypothetical protein